MDEKLYPNLEEEKVIERGELEKINETGINDALSKERYEVMLYKKDTIDTSLKHDMKIKKRYDIMSTSAKIGGIVITSGLTIATIVFTSGVAVPFFIIPLFGGLTVFSAGLSESIRKLLSRKKKRNRKKIEVRRDTLSKLEVYLEKARDDKVITLDEIESFHKIFNTQSAKIEDINKPKDTKKSSGSTSYFNRINKKQSRTLTILNFICCSPSVNVKLSY